MIDASVWKTEKVGWRNISVVKIIVFSGSEVPAGTK